jgi:hypothetical protein
LIQLLHRFLGCNLLETLVLPFGVPVIPVEIAAFESFLKNLLPVLGFLELCSKLVDLLILGGCGGCGIDRNFHVLVRLVEEFESLVDLP